MSTATECEQSAIQNAAGEESRYAILFELEGIAGSGRQATYEVLKSILGEQGISITPVHISRFCSRPSPEQYMEELLESVSATRQSADKLAEDARSGIAMQLSLKANSLPDPITNLLKAAGDQGIPIAALTALPKATAEALMENLGMNHLGVQLFVAEQTDDEHFPRADSWLKIAKALNRSAFHCGVIASTHAASKSALSAGMRCVAIPDHFTAFEDFSGANAIIEDISQANADEVLLDLCPHLNA